MPVIGQTREQYRQQQSMIQQQTVAQLVQIKQFRDQLNQSKQQFFYEHFIQQAIDLAGGDPVAAAQLNPELFDRFFSFTQNNRRAQKATNSLANGNLSGAGTHALSQYMSAGGKALFSDVRVKAAMLKAKTSGDLTSLETIVSEPTTEANKQAQLQAKYALQKWNPETKKFDTNFNDFSTERDRVRGGEIITPLNERIKEFKNVIGGAAGAIGGALSSKKKSTMDPYWTTDAYVSDNDLRDIPMPTISRNPYEDAKANYKALAESSIAPVTTPTTDARSTERGARRDRRQARQAERQLRRDQQEDSYWWEDAMVDDFGDEEDSWAGGNVYASGKNAYADGKNAQAQMNQYDQVTGDTHRPAMIGDKEMVMNMNATRQFGPLLQQMNAAAPNPAAALAPDSIPMGGGQQAPVAAAGGVMAFMGIMDKLLSNDDKQENTPKPTNSMGGPMAPSFKGGNVYADGKPAGGPIGYPSVPPPAPASMINLNTPVEQLAQMILSDPSTVTQLTEDQLMAIQEFTANEAAALESESDGAKWLKEPNSINSSEFTDSSPRISRASDILGDPRVNIEGASEILGVSERQKEEEGIERGFSIGHQGTFAPRMQDEGTPSVIYGQRAAPPIQAPSKETVEARGEKAQVAMDKVEADEPVTKQEQHALNAAANKASKWLIVNKDKANETPMDEDLMNFFLDTFYPEGMSLIDLTTSPKEAEQLKQGRKQLDLAEKGEDRLEKIRLTTISQFNQTMAINKEKLAASEEAQMLKQKMQLNIDMFKKMNERQWESYETVRDDFTMRLRDMAKAMKKDMSDPAVQEKFNKWVASDPEAMNRMNVALRTLAASTGLEIVQSWELVPDDERAGFWYNLTQLLGKGDKLDPRSTTGDPITAQLRSSVPGGAAGATDLTQYEQEPANLDDEVNDLLSGYDY